MLLQREDSGARATSGASGLGSSIHTDAATFAKNKLEQMTLEEKVSLLAGDDLWRTVAIPRLGISRIKTSDGPTGVRGGIFVDGVSAASLPSGVSLAATWDAAVIRDVSKVLIAEAKSKSVDVLLGPTVCIPRTPLGGRNFEAYSEDPLLTGRLAGEYIKTIQAAGIGTCIKHFAANDQEHRRFFIDENIPERALREIHLQPFQIAIREGNPWTLMTAYNKVNGKFCSMHHQLIQDVLRGEWGWDGLVMSDWFGTNSIVPSLTAGLDLEMPGPTRRRGKKVIDAYREGLLDLDPIDASAMRVLKLLHRVGKHTKPDWKEPPEEAVDLPEHRKILRQACAEGIVMLKNQRGLLPLQNLEQKRVAVIGPNATRSVATGGGSSNLLPHYRTTPYQSLKQAVEKRFPTARIFTKPGIITHRYLPLIDPAVMLNPNTNGSGFSLVLWRNMTHEGEPFIVENRPSSHLILYDGLPSELTTGAERYSYRATTIITPKTTGVHEFSLSTCGPGRLILDGKILIDIPRRWWSPKSALFMSYGSPEERVRVSMEAKRPYRLVLESVSREPKPYDISYMGELEREEVQDGGRIGFFENPGDLDDMFKDAVGLAESCDVAVVVVGKDHEWETETSDMDSMALPGRSDELISAVAKVNRNVIVVNQTGSPITMPWVDDVSAILQAWYQGQEQGNALTDVLLGDTNPSGKLPITFPRRIEDTPAFDNYPGDNDKTTYGEDIYLGYRFYDHRRIEPLFPFGAGLSYTSFAYANIRLSSPAMAGNGAPDDGLEAQVDVRNTGSRDGKETVQFYVRPLGRTKLRRPPQELKAWEKVYVKAGEMVTARCRLDRVSVSYWDDGIHKWVADANARFEVIAARDSRDAGIAAEFTVLVGSQWIN